MEFNLIRTEECKNSIFHSIHFYEYHQDNLLNHELIFQPSSNSLSVYTSIITDLNGWNASELFKPGSQIHTQNVT